MTFTDLQPLDEPEVMSVQHPLERRSYIPSSATPSEWAEFWGYSSYRRDVLTVPALYSCITAIADGIATLPLKLFEETEDGVGRPVKQHPAARALRRPNAYQNAHTFRRSMAMSLAGWGNAYAWIQRDSVGPTGLIYLPPWYVQPPHLASGLNTYQVVDPERQVGVIVPPQNMVHVVGATIDGRVGISPIQAHRHLYDADAAMSDYARAYYEKGARVSGFLETDANLNPEKRRELSEHFARAYGAGGDAEGKFAVLTNGLKFSPANLVSPVDARYIEAKRLSAVEIAMIFRVPPPLIGMLENATLNNVEALNRWFLTMTLGPYLEAIEAELGRKLLRERDQGGAGRRYFEHETERHMRGSPKDQAEANRIRIMAGYLTPNEARRRENLEPLPELNDPLRPGNMAPAGEEPEPPPAPTGAPAGDEILDAGGGPDGRKRPWCVATNGWAR